MKKNISIVLLITFILSLTSSNVFAAKNYVDLSEAEAKQVAGTVDGVVKNKKVQTKFQELIDLWHLNLDTSNDVGTFSQSKEWKYDINAQIKYGTKTDGGSHTCLGYAKYVFAYIFGVYSLNDAHIVKTYDLSYEGFKKNGVLPGAYIQGDGHTIIVFAYDKDSITIYDGNWERNQNNQSRIRVSKYSWDKILSRLNGKCKKIVMPKPEYLHSAPYDCETFKTIKKDGKTLLGACETCQTEFDWFSELDIINGTATIKSSNKNYKITLYKKPYEDAEKINTKNKVLKEFPVIGTVKNAYGNEWYAVDYQDNDGKVNWTGYIYSQTLTDNYKVTINNESNVERKESAAIIEKEHSHNYNYNNGQCYCGAVKATTQQTNAASTLKINLTKYPVQHTQGNNFGLRGTISSNYKIKKIYGYIKQNGNVIQSTEDSPNTKSVDVRDKKLNNNLVFETLGTGNYTLEVYAVDASGNGITVTKNFTVVGQTVKAESTLSINLDKYPVTLNAGSGFGLRGSITSNYNIALVKGYVINSSGQTVLSSKDTPNSTSMDIRCANLNDDLVFNNLGAGNYTMKVVATDNSGRTVEVSKAFSVISNTSSSNSTLAINLKNYPVTLDVGSSYGLRGPITSNYNISVVRGYVINSNGQTVLSSKDTPNSTYMDIKPAHLNADLIFNNLSAGNYTMRVVAVDASGRTVEATKNFTVKAKDVYVDNSPNGNGVTGTVAIPSSWENLSIRSGPSTNYQIVGSMNNGAKCTVYPNKTSNGWYYVNYNGIWGYASGNQINLNNSSNANTRTGIVNIPSSWTDLSIRTGPSTNYQIVGGMPQGARCTVYPDKASNGWYYVEYNGVSGYAAGNRINLQ